MRRCDYAHGLIRRTLLLIAGTGHGAELCLGEAAENLGRTNEKSLSLLLRAFSADRTRIAEQTVLVETNGENAEHEHTGDELIR